MQNRRARDIMLTLPKTKRDYVLEVMGHYRRINSKDPSPDMEITLVELVAATDDPDDWPRARNLAGYTRDAELPTRARRHVTDPDQTILPGTEHLL